MLNDRTWLWIAAAFYSAAFAWATWAIVKHHPRSRLVLLVTVILGLLAQTVGLHHRGMEAGGCPLGNKLEVVQFVVWSFTVLYLIVGPAFRLSLLGYFTSALAAVLSVISLLVPSWDGARQPPIFGGVPWIEMHASLGLFAYGTFGTLALTSLMFLLQTFSLKRKCLHGLFSFLPSIVALEGINLRLLLTGIGVLSVSIVLGFIYFARQPDAISPVKLWIATGIWGAYLGVLTLRLRRQLVSIGLAWACLALFVIALLSLGPINAGVRRKPAPVEPPVTASVPEP